MSFGPASPPTDRARFIEFVGTFAEAEDDLSNAKQKEATGGKGAQRVYPWSKLAFFTSKKRWNELCEFAIGLRFHEEL